MMFNLVIDSSKHMVIKITVGIITKITRISDLSFPPIFFRIIKILMSLIGIVIRNYSKCISNVHGHYIGKCNPNVKFIKVHKNNQE